MGILLLALGLFFVFILVCMLLSEINWTAVWGLVLVGSMAAFVWTHLLAPLV